MSGLLPPNTKSMVKRLAKRSKVYFRDSGLLHYLLGAGSIDSLDSRMTGMSWEGFVIENILRHTDIETMPSFYRTGSGVEIDLILTNAFVGKWIIEIKKGDPDMGFRFPPSTRHLKADRSFLVHGRSNLPRQTNSHGVEIISLLDMCREVADHFGRLSHLRGLSR